MKNRKLVLVFALIFSFAMIASACSGGGVSGPSKKVEPGSLTLPEKYGDFPEGYLNARNYYFAGDLADAPNQEVDYIIFFVNGQGSIQDAFDFYMERLEADESELEDNRAYIITGDERVNIHGRGADEFVDIKIYVPVYEFIDEE